MICFTDFLFSSVAGMELIMLIKYCLSVLCTGKARKQTLPMCAGANAYLCAKWLKVVAQNGFGCEYMQINRYARTNALALALKVEVGKKSAFANEC